MILRPEFYEDHHLDRHAEREKLGLHPDLPTALVLFGGEGSGAMWPIANHLGNSQSDLQLILICGRNKSLQQRLQSLSTRNSKFVEGFTAQIPQYMRLADFFIGKPGPGSISEAVRMGLPVIVERNSWTLPQERYNAEWVEENGVGVVLKSFREIEPAVQRVLSSGKLAAMRNATRCIENRAVFEIPDILEQVLEAPSGRRQRVKQSTHASILLQPAGVAHCDLHLPAQCRSLPADSECGAASPAAACRCSGH